MFKVVLDSSRDRTHHPLTVSATKYLFNLAFAIARSIPDAEVHAHLGAQRGDEVVFLGAALAGADVELF